MYKRTLTQLDNYHYGNAALNTSVDKSVARKFRFFVTLQWWKVTRHETLANRQRSYRLMDLTGYRLSYKPIGSFRFPLRLTRSMVGEVFRSCRDT